MENNNREIKPNRSVQPASGTARAKKDPRKAIAEIEKRRSNQRKKEQQKKQIIILAAALAVIIALIIILAVSCGKKDAPTDDTVQNGGVQSEQTANTASVPTPTPEPENSYTAEEYLMNLVPGATAQPEKYLDVIKDGQSGSKRIAVTVDDLNEVDNLNKIMTIAETYNAKLTLFAIGSVVDEKTDLQEAIRRADRLGYEIENHTYNHDRAHRLYSLTDEEMAYQIYMTQAAVNNALGCDYEMHFLRMPGGNGEYDLRTHQYLTQLGNYKAIVNWSYSGTDAKLKNIKNNLKDGYIFLFHCKDDDLKKLEEFIPYAVSQGYQLVTLNDLLGYEANTKNSRTGVSSAADMPAPYPFVYTNMVTLGNKNYTQLYAVQILQNRLIELGYLSQNASVDGDYGSTTKLAVVMFQYFNGLGYDGYAGKTTQELLFSSSARRNPSPYIAGENDPADASALEPYQNSPF